MTRISDILDTIFGLLALTALILAAWIMGMDLED